MALNGSPVLLVLTLTSKFRKAGCGMQVVCQSLRLSWKRRTSERSTCFEHASLSKLYPCFVGTNKVLERQRVLTVFIQTVGDQGHLPHAVVRL